MSKAELKEAQANSIVVRAHQSKTPRADALQHKQAHRDWNPESSKPVDHGLQIAEWVRLARELESELAAVRNALDTKLGPAIAALEATTAYVELYTGHGVRKQPPARYIKSDGSFNAEAIALDARVAIAKAVETPVIPQEAIK